MFATKRAAFHVLEVVSAHPESPTALDSWETLAVGTANDRTAESSERRNTFG